MPKLRNKNSLDPLAIDLFVIKRMCLHIVIAHICLKPFNKGLSGAARACLYVFITAAPIKPIKCNRSGLTTSTMTQSRVCRKCA